ncbi:MAG: zinc ribbon domain-containing protein [Chloroflexia bacterium]|nr:zinc ribbon domain-containing protein [Chloroflexia bacterium]
MELFEEILDTALPILRIVGIVIGAYLVVLWFSLVVWTYQDIRSRSESLLLQLFSTLLVLLFFLPGYWVYLLLRPKETLAEIYARTLEREYIIQDIEERPVCPTCQRSIEPDFVMCPYCHTPLRKKCPACGRVIDLTWQVCPYCGQ